jgi:uncharacterized protein YyaL (SSP411 family)
MAKGGMRDQIGGGFHRYSVDARWFVPHFEKMLYDQAQLAVSYVEAFQITHDETFASVARDTLDYVIRDMTHPEGGFYSAEDADSVIDPAKPHEKGEGAFYIWSRDEIDRIFGEPVADWFSWRYGVEDAGNVHDDPHGEFTGRNILYQKFTVEETARHFEVDPAAVHDALEDAASKLMLVRSRRVRPHLDDKILTAWNGLMISAFAKASGALHEPDYLQAAQRANAFIAGRLHSGGKLLRRWREGEGAIPAFLDDYAFYAQALLDLYEADFDEEHVQRAVALTDRMCELFEDTRGGGFYSTTAEDPSLVMRIKEDYDGAEPSGNSIAVLNLLRLARITGNTAYAEGADRALRAFSRNIHGGPIGLPQMLTALMLQSKPPQQIVIAGAQAELGPMLDMLRSRFLPFHTLLWAGNTSLNPELNGMPAQNGRPTAYVCENFACQLPVTDVNALAGLLQ